MRLNILEYIEKSDAAVGILVRLDDDDGLIQNELQEQVHVSPGTLQTALTQAKEEDLVKTINKRSDHGNSNRYILTERGAGVKTQIQAVGMDEVYEQFFEAHRQLDEMEEELKERIREEDIDHHKWPEEPDPGDLAFR